MSNPGDDQDPNARSAADVALDRMAADTEARSVADAELARRDRAAVEMLDESAKNLSAIALKMENEGYTDAAGVVRRTAADHLAIGVRDALQGEFYQDAATDWGASALALRDQATERAAGNVAKAEQHHAEVVLDQHPEGDLEHTLAMAAAAAAEARVEMHAHEADQWGSVADNTASEAFDAEEQARKI